MRPRLLHKSGLKCILRCRISRLTSQQKKNAADQLIFLRQKLHDSIISVIRSFAHNETCIPVTCRVKVIGINKCDHLIFTILKQTH